MEEPHYTAKQIFIFNAEYDKFRYIAERKKIMAEYKFFSLHEKPEFKYAAVEWFSRK